MNEHRSEQYPSRESITVSAATILVLLVAACAALPPSRTAVVPASSAMSETSPVLVAAFRDNTSEFIPKSQDEAAVKDLMVHNLQAAFERDDLKLLEIAVSESFELWIKPRGTETLVYDRAGYLASRMSLSSPAAAHRSLDYSIRSVSSAAGVDTITVVAFATYKTQFFNPRFFDTLVFRKVEGRWLLDQEILIPIHPALPEGHGVQIFLVDRPWSELQSSFNDGKQTDQGIESAIAMALRDGQVEQVSTDNRHHTVLFVFREPPAVGTTIEIEHSDWRPWAQNMEPHKFKYVVTESQRFFVIANESFAGGKGGSGGKLTYRVFVNGTKVAEKEAKTY